MSFESINNGISALMKGIKFDRSKQMTIESVPTTEHGNVFLLTPLSGSNNEKSSETLSDRVYDVQTWKIEFPFPKSSESQDINSDDMNRKRDLIVKTLDNPRNWESYVRIQKFIDWNIEDRKNFFLLTVRLKIVDTIIY